jgi:hypothetical protein
MLRSKTVVTAVLAAAVAPTAGVWAASPAVDGSLDASFYGAAKAVQAVQTQFGDSTSGSQTDTTGSELDAAYARIANGNLYVFFAGNLENNFNKLEIFVDAGRAGQNTIRRDNADVNFNALARMGENLDGTNISATDKIGKGLTFDAGFNSNYYMTVNGGGSGAGYAVYSDFATTPADPTNAATPSTGMFVGGSTPDNNRVINGASGIKIAIDNSNTGGVAAGTQPPAGSEFPAGVTTGVEVAIPLSLLGNPTSPLKVTALVNGGGHDFLSNQVLGPVIPAPDFGNLGEPRTTDFSTISGDQFFTVPLLAGDANGDGFVNADDFARIDRGFNKHLTGWSNGDFNNSGTVDQADYQIINAAFAAQQSGGGAPAGILAAVPEPASSGLALAAAALAARRKRHRIA